MMTRQHLKDAIEAVGFVLLIASLIFVGLQIRQDHRIARAQNAADFDDTMIEYARVINANREVWIKGLEGAELSLVDQVTFEVVAFAVWQKFSGIHSRNDLLGGRGRDKVARQLASELYIFPGLRQYFLARCEHHESMGFLRSFCRDVKEQLGKLDDGTLPPPKGKLYVL
jgi:hypothetical protein